eukprot:207886-Rhodomonas_salina.1
MADLDAVVVVPQDAPQGHRTSHSHAGSSADEELSPCCRGPCSGVSCTNILTFPRGEPRPSTLTGLAVHVRTDRRLPKLWECDISHQVTSPAESSGALALNSFLNAWHRCSGCGAVLMFPEGSVHVGCSICGAARRFGERCHGLQLSVVTLSSNLVFK